MNSEIPLVPGGEPGEVRRRRAGERVDRLVVVADDADVLSVAEPHVEQRGLERVHVLELVDRERVEPLAEGGGGVAVLLEESDREREHVLEVDPPHRALLALVALVDAGHQVDGVQLAASRFAELPDGSVRLSATNPVLLLWGRR